MENSIKKFQFGQKVLLDIDTPNSREVEVIGQTPNKLFTTIQYKVQNEQTPRQWEVTTNRLTPILTNAQSAYLTDEMYLPIQYKGIEIQQPFFKGKGVHSVKELEEICERFKEYMHQQLVIKQKCMQHICELKFNVKF